MLHTALACFEFEIADMKRETEVPPRLFAIKVLPLETALGTCSTRQLCVRVISLYSFYMHSRQPKNYKVPLLMRLGISMTTKTGKDRDTQLNLSLNVLGGVLLVVDTVVRSAGDRAAFGTAGRGSLLGVKVGHTLFFGDGAENNIHTVRGQQKVSPEGKETREKMRTSPN